MPSAPVPNSRVPVAEGEPVRWVDVQIDHSDVAVRVRREMAAFGARAAASALSGADQVGRVSTRRAA